MPRRLQATSVRRFSRRVLTAACLLAAAVVINVGIAWTCSAFVPPWGSPEAGGQGGNTNWYADGHSISVTAHKRPGITTTVVQTMVMERVQLDLIVARQGATRAPADELALPRWSAAAHLRDAGGAPPAPARPAAKVQMLIDQGHGWPLPVLRYRYFYLTPTDRPGTIDVEIQDGLPLPTSDLTVFRWPLVRALPLRPIWSALVAQSVGLALLLWGAVAAPRAARRLIRRRRGRCATCGYPAGIASTCSECGATT